MAMEEGPFEDVLKRLVMCHCYVSFPEYIFLMAMWLETIVISYKLVVLASIYTYRVYSWSESHCTEFKSSKIVDDYFTTRFPGQKKKTCYEYRHLFFMGIYNSTPPPMPPEIGPTKKALLRDHGGYWKIP